MAIWARRGELEGLVHHSDSVHGVQFTSWAFTRRAKGLWFGAIDGFDRFEMLHLTAQTVA